MKYLLLGLALFTLACKSTAPGWLAMPHATTKDGVEVVAEGVVRGTTWISGITGTATNVSPSPLARCEISFEVYSMHGVPLGTAHAEREGLAAGETWKFKAMFPRRISDASTLSSARVVVTR